MTEPQTHAWIFLSVPEQPAALQDVIAMADAINHAIPSDRELRGSLGWLVAQGLIRKDGRRYLLTPEGIALRTETSKKLMMKTWDAVTAKFAVRTTASISQEDLAPKDITAAYDAYRENFQAAYKKLTEKEK